MSPSLEMNPGRKSTHDIASKHNEGVLKGREVVVQFLNIIFGLCFHLSAVTFRKFLFLVVATFRKPGNIGF